MTKWNYLVKNVNDLPRIINEAFLIATTGRPGPVLVDLPKDVTTAICTEEVDDTPRPHILKRKTAYMAAHARQVQDSGGDDQSQSKKPVLYVGGGAIISGAWQEVRKLADKANIPCTTTLLGLGAFDEHGSRRRCTCWGCMARRTANYAVQESDCLIAVGARFDDRVTGNLATFAPKAKIIHIDIDPAASARMWMWMCRWWATRKAVAGGDAAAHRASRPAGMVGADQRLEEAISVQLSG